MRVRTVARLLPQIVEAHGAPLDRFVREPDTSRFTVFGVILEQVVEVTEVLFDS